MRSLGIRVAVVLLVLGAMLGGRLLLGSAMGAPCSDAFVCNALPARCVLDASGAGGYCSRPCDDASACSPGWACAAVERRDERGSVLELESVCVRPGEASSARHTLRRR